MAIEYILSGDTNNTGRLKINAAFDEIITGTTLSTNDGEYILEQFDGTQLIGTVRLPNSQSEPSYIFSTSLTGNTLLLSKGSYNLNGKIVNIAGATTVTLNLNLGANDRYDSIYVDEFGGIQVVEGSAAAVPETPFVISAGTSFALIANIRVKANNEGFVLANQATYENINVHTTNPDYQGGLYSTMLGGYIPLSVDVLSGKTVYSGAVDNAFAYGDFNRVEGNNSSIFGGNDNQVTAQSSSIVGAYNSRIINTSSSDVYDFIGGGENNLISASTESAIIGGQNNTITQTSDNSFIAAGFDNEIKGDTDFGAIIASDGSTLSVNSNYVAIISGQDNTISDNCEFSAIIGSANSTIDGNSDYSTILGGIQNTIESNSDRSSIIAGSGNKATSNFDNSVIVTGLFNSGFSSNYSTIIGGQYNTIGSIATVGDSAVIGGNNNDLTEGNDSGIFASKSTSINDGEYSTLIATNNSSISVGTGIAFIGGRNNTGSDTSYGGIFGSQNSSIGGDVGQVLIAGNAQEISRSNTVVINTNSYTANTSNTQEYSTTVENLNVISGLTLATSVITTSATTTANDYHLAVETSSVAPRITLLASPLDGRTYIIKDIDGNASVNNITVDGNGNNIDGAATQTISTNYGSLTIIYNSRKGVWYTS